MQCVHGSGEEFMVAVPTVRSTVVSGYTEIWATDSHQQKAPAVIHLYCSFRSVVIPLLQFLLLRIVTHAPQ